MAIRSIVAKYSLEDTDPDLPITGEEEKEEDFNQESVTKAIDVAFSNVEKEDALIEGAIALEKIVSSLEEIYSISDVPGFETTLSLETINSVCRNNNISGIELDENSRISTEGLSLKIKEIWATIVNFVKETFRKISAAIKRLFYWALIKSKRNVAVAENNLKEAERLIKEAKEAEQESDTLDTKEKVLELPLTATIFPRYKWFDKTNIKLEEMLKCQKDLIEQMKEHFNGYMKIYSDAQDKFYDIVSKSKFEDVQSWLKTLDKLKACHFPLPFGGKTRVELMCGFVYVLTETKDMRPEDHTSLDDYIQLTIHYNNPIVIEPEASTTLNKYDVSITNEAEMRKFYSTNLDNLEKEAGMWGTKLPQHIDSNNIKFTKLVESTLGNTPLASVHPHHLNKIITLFRSNAYKFSKYHSGLSSYFLLVSSDLVECAKMVLHNAIEVK